MLESRDSADRRDWILLRPRDVAFLPGNQLQSSEINRFSTLAFGDFGDNYLANKRADFRRRIRQIVRADGIDFGVANLDLQFISARGDIRQTKGTVAVTKGAEALPGTVRLEKTIGGGDIIFPGRKIVALGTRAGFVGRFQTELDRHGFPVDRVGGAGQDGVSHHRPATASEDYLRHSSGIDHHRGLVRLKAGLSSPLLPENTALARRHLVEGETSRSIGFGFKV